MGIQNYSESSYTAAPNHLFNVGELVRVINARPPGHRRTPGYIRGKVGIIERICGAYPNPEELAYGFDGLPKRVLYRVAFKQLDVWSDYKGSSQDQLEIEIFEHWLDAVEE
ncbi:MAG: SH3-like domain-containing protein [Pseudomonadota bacterium]|nr:SH3-like domain-containing protein [Pseudomonadota bacterium]